MARTPVSYGLTDFFKSFKSRHPKTDIDRKVHATILACTGNVITETLLQEGQFKLFSRMGNFLIRCAKPKNARRRIDYNETRKLGHKVYHFNDHSDGYLVKFIWDRKHCILADKFMWLFKPVRQVKRQLAREMKQGGKNYPIQL